MFNLQSKDPGVVILKALVGIFIVYLIVFIGALSRNALKQFSFIGKAERPQNTIMVNGEGKTIGKSDVAVVEIGFLTEKADVVSAQKDNTEKMNKLIAEVKKLGVKDDDIQTTQYQIYPKYDYPDGKSALSGYTVAQSVTLKIRELAKISPVLAKVGEVGVNQVSGLTFTIDNPELLKTEARAQALADAKAKAEVLARSLGVRLVRVVSFSESMPVLPMDFKYRTLMGEGMGGGAPLPDIQSGSLEVRVQASVIYEIE